MKRYLLDTSFLSAFFNTNDLNHHEAVAISKDITSSQILIPSVVFAELMSFSKDKKRRDLNIEISLKMADGIPHLDESNLLEYIKFASNLPNTFTAMDSVILFLAKENNAELITLDKKLQKLYKKV